MYGLLKWLQWHHFGHVYDYECADGQFESDRGDDPLTVWTPRHCIMSPPPLHFTTHEKWNDLVFPTVSDNIQCTSCGKQELSVHIFALSQRKQMRWTTLRHFYIVFQWTFNLLPILLVKIRHWMRTMVTVIRSLVHINFTVYTCKSTILCSRSS